MQSCGKLGLGARSRLPALERGRGLCQKSWELDQEEIKLFGHEPASKTNTSWLKVILHAFGVGTSHGLTRTHLTHKRPDSKEATTFPFIVFFAAPRRGYIQMAFFPETPKEESRNCPEIVPVWTPWTLGNHNFAPRARIGTRFEPKLQLLSRAFQRHVVLPLQTSGRGRFPTFSGQESNCQFDSRPFFCP